MPHFKVNTCSKTIRRETRNKKVNKSTKRTVGSLVGQTIHSTKKDHYDNY